MSKPTAVRSPELRSSSELASPASALASLRNTGRRRTGSSAVEPFPTLESEGTASTVESIVGIPQTTLLSSINPKATVERPPKVGQSDPTKDINAQKQQQQSLAKASTTKRSQTDHTDAIWAEMKATLADVELSASRGTHFFGSKHSAALEELRMAQMALAQAWSRGEDGSGMVATEGKHVNGQNGTENGEVDLDDDDDDADSGLSPGTSLKDGEPKDRDVDAARKRREANDRYFTRIQQGVNDVVEKLEGVAKAMGKVEKESREIWSSESELEDSIA